MAALAESMAALRLSNEKTVLLKRAGQDVEASASSFEQEYKTIARDEWTLGVKKTARRGDALTVVAREFVRRSRDARLGAPGRGGAVGVHGGDDDGFLPRLEWEPFLEPDYSARYTTPKPKESTNRYLAAVKSQVLAEYAGFLSSAFAQRYEIVRPEGAVDSLYDFDESTQFLGLREPTGDELLDGKQFHNSLGVFKGHLVIVKFIKEEKRIRLIKGKAWAGRRLPPPDGPLEIMVLGYIGDYVYQHAAARAFEEGTLPAPMLLHHVADPTKRRDSAAYGSELREVSPAVPLNDRQRAAIREFKTSLEGIQGPPGTGKSTLIFHLVNSRLPPDDVALATCVQNKAVDAIAEKFATVGEIPFFVLGNEDRLGAVASEWTVDEQVKRDPRVVVLSAAERRVTALALRVELDVARAERRATKDPETDYLAKAKALAAIAAPLRAAADDVKTEAKATAAAARAEIVAGARVVLCTVATASRTLLLEDEFAPVVSRIATAILDEAGTCAEPNVPLLLLLPSLKRVVAIGDQKQLAPFSQIQPGTAGGARLCFAFQKGRCRYGRDCRFAHEVTSSDEPLGFFQRLELALPPGSVPILVDQYRMHPTIAECVSENFYDGRLRTPREIEVEREDADPRGMYWLTRDRGADETARHPRPRRRCDRSDDATAPRTRPLRRDRSTRQLGRDRSTRPLRRDRSTRPLRRDRSTRPLRRRDRSADAGTRTAKRSRRARARSTRPSAGSASKSSGSRRTATRASW